jgi:predicted transcriptional regulator
MEKVTILNTLKKLPNEFDLDEFLEQLIVIEKINEGLDDLDAGKIISHEKVKKMVAKWQK